MTRVLAETIKAGDFLPDLDNGYVVEVDHDPDLRTEYNSIFGDGLVLITFHDENGDENYLLLSPETFVRVKR